MTQPAEAFLHYVLETQNAGVDIRVLLNGVELLRGVPAAPKITSEKINGWLVSGENRIQIFAAVPDPAHSVGQVNVKCLLFRGPVGRQPEESEALLRFAQDDKTKLPAGAMQAVWQDTFKPDPFYGPWVWESSLPILQAQVAVTAALGVIRNMITALNAHHTAEIQKLFRVYVDEMSRAYESNADRLRAQLQSWTEGWTPAPAPPLVAEDYVMLVEENKKLLRIDRKDGLPLCTVNPKAPGSGPKRLYLTDTALGWTIVR